SGSGVLPMPRRSSSTPGVAARDSRARRAISEKREVGGRGREVFLIPTLGGGGPSSGVTGADRRGPAVEAPPLVGPPPGGPPRPAERERPAAVGPVHELDLLTLVGEQDGVLAGVAAAPQGVETDLARPARLDPFATVDGQLGELSAHRRGDHLRDRERGARRR